MACNLHMFYRILSSVYFSLSWLMQSDELKTYYVARRGWTPTVSFDLMLSNMMYFPANYHCQCLGRDRNTGRQISMCQESIYRMTLSLFFLFFVEDLWAWCSRLSSLHCRKASPASRLWIEGMFMPLSLLIDSNNCFPSFLHVYNLMVFSNWAACIVDAHIEDWKGSGLTC